MTNEQKEIANKEIILLTIQDVMDLTGWGENITRNMFAHDEDFPAIKKGKYWQVTLKGLEEYLTKEGNKRRIEENV